MRRPTTVRVLGKPYKIEWDSEALGHLAGDHSQPELTVRVAPRLAPDEERETLLHELTHAIETNLGINIAERKLRAFSVGFYALLRDNPRLRSYLFGERK